MESFHKRGSLLKIGHVGASKGRHYDQRRLIVPLSLIIASCHASCSYSEVVAQAFSSVYLDSMDGCSSIVVLSPICLIITVGIQGRVVESDSATNACIQEYQDLRHKTLF